MFYTYFTFSLLTVSRSTSYYEVHVGHHFTAATLLRANQKSHHPREYIYIYITLIIHIVAVVVVIVSRVSSTAVTTESKRTTAVSHGIH
jgi:hypothetical protein